MGRYANVEIVNMFKANSQKKREWNWQTIGLCYEPGDVQEEEVMNCQEHKVTTTTIGIVEMKGIMNKIITMNKNRMKKKITMDWMMKKNKRGTMKIKT